MDSHFVHGLSGAGETTLWVDRSPSLYRRCNYSFFPSALAVPLCSILETHCTFVYGFFRIDSLGILGIRTR